MRGLKRRINLHFVSKRSSTRAFEKGRGYAWRAVITQQLWKEWESKNVFSGLVVSGYLASKYLSGYFIRDQAARGEGEKKKLVE